MPHSNLDALRCCRAVAAWACAMSSSCAFLAESCAFRLFARGNERPLRLGDGEGGRGALRHPGIRGIEVVAAKEQRFRLAPRAPARREFAKPRVLPDPVEIDPQRLGQFCDRARERAASIETHEIQAAEFF